MSKSDQLRALRERQFAEHAAPTAPLSSRPSETNGIVRPISPARCEACQIKEARIAELEAAVVRLEALLAAKRAVKAKAQAKWRTNRAAGSRTV